MPGSDFSVKDVYELVDKKTDSILTSFDGWKKNEFIPLKNRVEGLEKRVDKIWLYISFAATVTTVVAQFVVNKGLEIVGSVLANN